MISSLAKKINYLIIYENIKLIGDLLFIIFGAQQIVLKFIGYF